MFFSNDAVHDIKDKKVAVLILTCLGPSNNLDLDVPGREVCHTLEHTVTGETLNSSEV